VIKPYGSLVSCQNANRSKLRSSLFSVPSLSTGVEKVGTTKPNGSISNSNTKQPLGTCKTGQY